MNADSTRSSSSSTDANGNGSSGGSSHNRIRVLPQTVVDRIAAGEVVQRPAAAVKELCENSLDAGGTRIRVVVVHQGGSSAAGLDQFSVHDNGAGISRADLPLACARHATSKLATADDLQNLQSFGFRGEALASLSAVSRLAIVSRTARAAAAYQMPYRDGQPVAQPAPTARTVGTTVHCRDLFYNVPGRRRASSSSAADDYRAVLRTLQSYALHCARTGVAFQLQKQSASRGGGGNSGSSNSTKTDLNTETAVAPLQRLLAAQAHPSGAKSNSHGDDGNDDNDVAGSKDEKQQLEAARDAATKQVIAQIYGSQLLPHLLPVSSELCGGSDADDDGGGDYDDDDDDGAAGLDDEKKEIFVSSSRNNNDDDDDNNDDDNENDNSSRPKDNFIYTCTGFVTSPSFHQVAAAGGGATASGKIKVGGARRSGRGNGVVLFINHRLVDGCTAFRRRVVDDAYAECGLGRQQKPPLVYLSLQVPPHAVDVNVHPTKREVTLLHHERIARHLGGAVRAALRGAGQSFRTAAAAPKQTPIQNPYAASNRPPKSGSSSNATTESRKRPEPEEDSAEPSTSDDSQRKRKQQQQQQPLPPPKKKKSMVRTSRSTQSGALEPYLVPRTQLSQQQSSGSTTAISSSQSSSWSQSLTTQQSQHLAAQNGRFSAASASSSSLSQTPTETPSPPSTFQHATDCPLSASPTTTTMDLSQPGAFAAAASQCNCRAASRTISSDNSSEKDAVTIRLPRQALGGASKRIRLQRLAPTPCQFTSIRKLRQRLQRQRSAVWEKRLRSACFVGTVSHDRSLVQCGEALVLVHHGALAQELFAQLALNSFGGGCGVARLPGGDGNSDNDSNNNDNDSNNDNQNNATMNEATTSAASTVSGEQDALNSNNTGIDIAAVVGSFVQFEDILQNSSDLEEPPSLPVAVSETNQALAEQVADCLLQHAEMLLEYFSIEITKDDQGRARLTGLPVLLEGYEPSPHGLPLFLLRLATEVDWSEERPCFAGVCRELGAYYAQLPSTASSAQHAARVRHTIFPAVSTLLVPTEPMVEGSSSNDHSTCFTTLTTLPKLYKVFERC